MPGALREPQVTKCRWVECEGTSGEVWLWRGQPSKECELQDETVGPWDVCGRQTSGTLRMSKSWSPEAEYVT